MVEELPKPRKNVPLVINLSIIIGTTSGISFMIDCFFRIQGTNKVIDTPTGLPFVELMLQTTDVKATLALIALFVFNEFGQETAMLTAISRLTWDFA